MTVKQLKALLAKVPDTLEVGVTLSDQEPVLQRSANVPGILIITSSNDCWEVDGRIVTEVK